MEQPKLGTLPQPTDGRDAVHVAILPVRAHAALWPGQKVGCRPDGDGGLVSAAGDAGVVDPFLAERVKQGQYFYLCLPPRTVTSLRHVWVHPGFPEEVPGVRLAERDDERPAGRDPAG